MTFLAVELGGASTRNATLLALALSPMEEVVVTDGHVQNPTFTSYLVPTILDLPPMRVEVLEYAGPHAPYGTEGESARIKGNLFRARARQSWYARRSGGGRC